MAQEITSDKDFLLIKTSSDEVLQIGGLGICDRCCESKPEGYIIATLAGRWYCESCYSDWHSGAINYPEDRNYEETTHRKFVRFLSSRGVEIQSMKTGEDNE